MIESRDMCYLYKIVNVEPGKLYKRIVPDTTKNDALEKWNTHHKDEAGCLPKIEWMRRYSKWTYRDGYVLEATNGETEVL